MKFALALGLALALAIPFSPAQETAHAPKPSPTRANVVRAKPAPTPAETPAETKKEKRKFWEWLFPPRKPKASPSPEPAPSPTPKPRATPRPASAKAASAASAASTASTPASTPRPRATPESANTFSDAIPFVAPDPGEPAPALPDPLQEEAEKERYREVRTKALEDPAILKLQQTADTAAQGNPQKTASKAYYKALFQKMRALDPSLKERIDRMEAATLRRVESEN